MSKTKASPPTTQDDVVTAGPMLAEPTATVAAPDAAPALAPAAPSASAAQIASPDGGAGAAPRAEAMTSLQGSVGNARAGAFLDPAPAPAPAVTPPAVNESEGTEAAESAESAEAVESAEPAEPTDSESTATPPSASEPPGPPAAPAEPAAPPAPAEPAVPSATAATTETASPVVEAPASPTPAAAGATAGQKSGPPGEGVPKKAVQGPRGGDGGEGPGVSKATGMGHGPGTSPDTGGKKDSDEKQIRADKKDPGKNKGKAGSSTAAGRAPAAALPAAAPPAAGPEAPQGAATALLAAAPAVLAAPAPASFGAGSGASTYAIGFLSAPGSHIASNYAGLGGALGERFVTDRKAIVASAPDIRASIGTAPPKPPATTAPPPPYTDGGRGKAAVNMGTKLAGSRLKRGSVYKKTKDTDLAAPGKEFSGATASVGKKNSALAAQIAANQAGEKVRPAELSLTRRIELPPPATPVKTVASREMEDYTALDLPASTRRNADNKLAPLLDKRLAGSRDQIAQATEKSQADREAALQRSRAEADALSAQSEARQNEIVAGARGKVEKHKQDGIDEARAEVQSFEKDAGERHRKTLDEANQKIDTDQKRADDKVAEANKKAAAEKRKAKKKEKAAKAKAKKKKKNRKWYQKIGDFFSKIAKALAKAVTSIIKAVTKVVKSILKAAKKFVNGIVSALAKVLKGILKAFASVLKSLVNNLIGRIFPGIAAKINAAIDATVDFACKAVDAVADAVKDSVNWIVEKANQIVDTASNLACAAVAAATALAVGLLKGDFLEALKMAFLAACEQVGLPGQELLDMLARAGKLIWEVIKHPATFLKHLLKSVWGGIQLFVAAIVPNFMKGLMGWIFGQVAATGIELPKKFDLESILGLVLQVVGLTMANVRAQAVNVFGDRNVEFAEGVIKFIGILFQKGPGAFFRQIVVAAKALPDLLFESAATWAENRFGERGRTVVEGIRANFDALLDGGPAALWANMKNQLSGIKDAIISGIREWVMEKIVAIAVEKLATMTNPVGAFIQAILMIYRTIKFFVERIKQILDVVNKILDSIATVAKGLIGAAAQAISKTMVASLPLMISFLADLIGLGGIGAKVRKIIEKIQGPVNKAIVWLFTKIKKGVEWIFAKIKGLLGKARGKGGKDLPDGALTAESQVKGDRSPEERKEGAKRRFVSLMQAKNSLSPKEIEETLISLQQEFSLSDAKLERGGVQAKIAFYASPATFLPVTMVPVGGGGPAAPLLGQKPGAAGNASVMAGDYIQATSYDGPHPTPGGEVVKNLDTRFQGQPHAFAAPPPAPPPKKKQKGAAPPAVPVPVPIPVGHVSRGHLPLRTKTNDNSYMRAGKVKAQSSVPRGHGRSGARETVFGHFGADEENIATGVITTQYNGGHLVGDQVMDSHQSFNLYEDWNLAPQIRAFNSPLYTSSIENAVTHAIAAGSTVEYTVTVQYPAHQYQIQPSNLIKHLLPAADQYRQRVEAAIALNGALDAPFSFTRRIPGFWLAEATVKAGPNLKSGNVNPRANIAFTNDPVAVQPNINYQPGVGEQGRYALEVNTGAGIAALPGPPPINYIGANHVRETVRQQTFG